MLLAGILPYREMDEVWSVSRTGVLINKSNHRTSRSRSLSIASVSMVDPIDV